MNKLRLIHCEKEFTDLKEILKFSQFKRRGLIKVKIDFKLNP